MNEDEKRIARLRQQVDGLTGAIEFFLQENAAICEEQGFDVYWRTVLEEVRRAHSTPSSDPDCRACGGTGIDVSAGPTYPPCLKCARK